MSTPANSYVPYIPLMVAAISAATVVFGYFYQKRKERQFEIHKTRQEIYTEFVRNLSERLNILQPHYSDPDIARKFAEGDLQGATKIMLKRCPELEQNSSDARKIMSLMALYASDEAIQSCAQFQRDRRSDAENGPEVDELMFKLRKTLFPETEVTRNDIAALIMR